MTTPAFILALREHVGTELLWLCGATAVVTRAGEVLLVRSVETGSWGPVSGIVEPGEAPADTAVRETREETGVVAVPERLARVSVTDVVTYRNGDRCQFVDLTFALTWVSGQPEPVDGENTEARWFPLDDLPPLAASARTAVDAALAERPEASFDWSAG